LSDLAQTGVLPGFYEPDEHGRRAPECLYGSVKIWAYLNREGIQVAKCTVERLMRAHGWKVCDGSKGSAPQCLARTMTGHRIW
jgi:hypothetical protein